MEIKKLGLKPTEKAWAKRVKASLLSDLTRLSYLIDMKANEEDSACDHFVTKVVQLVAFHGRCWRRLAVAKLGNLSSGNRVYFGFEKGNGEVAEWVAVPTNKSGHS